MSNVISVHTLCMMTYAKGRMTSGREMANADSIPLR
jgi:hypothetical protein